MYIKYTSPGLNDEPLKDGNKRKKKSPGFTFKHEEIKFKIDVDYD